MIKLPVLLSRRQFQVATLLASGLTIKEISATTGLNRSVIQYHLFHMRQVFCCKTNFQLAYELKNYLDQLTQALKDADLKATDPFTWPQKTQTHGKGIPEFFELGRSNVYQVEDLNQDGEPVYVPLDVSGQWIEEDQVIK